MVLWRPHEDSLTVCRAPAPALRERVLRPNEYTFIDSKTVNYSLLTTDENAHDKKARFEEVTWLRALGFKPSKLRCLRSSCRTVVQLGTRGKGGGRDGQMNAKGITVPRAHRRHRIFSGIDWRSSLLRRASRETLLHVTLHARAYAYRLAMGA